MDSSTKQALDALDRVCESPGTVGPIELDADYTALLERVSALPENRSGTDKTWVEESHARWLAHYRAARRI